MNDRFTENVKKSLFLARDEAGRLQNDFIGSEHFLLGILRNDDAIAIKVLQSLGVDRAEIMRRIVEATSPKEGTLTIGEIPFTRGAKWVLELAVEEARLLGHDYIGTEHLLLAILRSGDGVVADVLDAMQLTHERVREETLKVLAATDREVSFGKASALGVRRHPFDAREKQAQVPLRWYLRMEALCRLLVRKKIITAEELDRETRSM